LLYCGPHIFFNKKIKYLDNEYIFQVGEIRLFT